MADKITPTTYRMCQPQLRWSIRTHINNNKVEDIAVLQQLWQIQRHDESGDFGVVTFEWQDVPEHKK